MKSACFLVPLVIAFCKTTEVIGGTCYVCNGKECMTGLGTKVECGDVRCGQTIDYDGVEVAPGGIRRRYCGHFSNEAKEHSCFLISLEEECLCGGDLCNAERPPCSSRNLGHSEVRKVMRQECAEEINEQDKFEARMWESGDGEPQNPPM